MEKIVSQINTSSGEFKDNDKHHRGLLDELSSRIDLVKECGGKEYVERHHRRGKLTARERISQLIDPGSPFLELSELAAYEVYDFACPSAGIITGIGRIHNRLCMIVANDATVKAGHMSR